MTFARAELLTAPQNEDPLFPKSAGHYVALVKNSDKWLLYEDESVELVNEGVVQSVFGSSQVNFAV